MSKLNSLNDATINDFISNSEVPIFIDLWAEWCSPCKKIEPTLESLADEYVGKMAFYKLDTAENPNTVEKYNIMSLPNFLIIDPKKGLLDQFIGAVPKQKFTKKINSALEKITQ